MAFHVNVPALWRHMAVTLQQMDPVANADGTKPCPITATAAVVFNVGEAAVTPTMRQFIIARVEHAHAQ